MSWGAWNDARYADMRNRQDRARERWAFGAKDHERECLVCGALPTVHPTELCGPCCFGSADTLNGNWPVPGEGRLSHPNAR